jgi:hypothetical protein
MLVPSPSHLDIQKQVSWTMLPLPEKREKDLINYGLIQLFTDLLSEELPHETRTHWFSFFNSLLKEYIKN